MTLCIKKISFIGLVFMLLFNSCTSINITKRRYSNGFHIDFSTNKYNPLVTNRKTTDKSKFILKDKDSEIVVQGQQTITELNSKLAENVNDSQTQESLPTNTFTRVLKTKSDGQIQTKYNQKEISEKKITKRSHKSTKQEKKSWWYNLSIILIAILPLGAAVAIYVIHGPGSETNLLIAISFALYMMLYLPGVIFGTLYLLKEKPEQSDLNEILVSVLIVWSILILLGYLYNNSGQ